MDPHTQAVVADQVWHTLHQEALTVTLGASLSTGLTERDAAERLARFGENRLAEAQPRPLWLKFLDQFKNLLVIVLLFAAALAWAIGDLKDAVVILLVVVFNAALGFYQEHRAERTLAALRGMLAAHARVRRAGQVREIEAVFLVPGDIVLLEAGDRIPADGRLLAAHNLEVEEAALTGESHAVGKSVATLMDANLPLGDRINLLYMNTVLTRGRAELLVTATGMKTEMGKLAGMIAARLAVEDSPMDAAADAVYAHGLAADDWPTNRALTASALATSRLGTFSS